MQYYDILKTACSDVGIDFNEEQYSKFIKYKDMIKDWNNKINLTAITEDEEIIKKHFIDCIKIYKCSVLRDLNDIIDIGTGAGFPGIPIKIIDNAKRVVLLDSLNKRINFLNEVVKELDLNDVVTLHGRAEDYSKQDEYREKFDAVVSRAVANLAVLSEFCLPYVKVNGYFIAMKGPAVEEEIKNGTKAINILGGQIEDVIQLNIEGSDLKHNLVVIKKVKNTPAKYPRKAGTASKNPLK
ncbi:16S rRNA (guanine(527)-N(7))-methyltransferase RsmG [Clostridium sp. MSJ-11]|uniref:Ribosomal RNA small subunit methyltransferase G n=1 Tax=Clostridium mobile TaxID=2841512 RepID=A0ABS6EMD8_9CLOT|nr:16S rRNA (guanine(527)-N(7))-methyltransferase RsmG [Clostridium mobile]MBU5486396.1 16S rRNA (guanine(527)-N(7))-methyltransferase RsmG [Clostridium mobile]